jgi:hypothetical protein
VKEGVKEGGREEEGRSEKEREHKRRVKRRKEENRREKGGRGCVVAVPVQDRVGLACGGVFLCCGTSLYLLKGSQGSCLKFIELRVLS